MPFRSTCIQWTQGCCLSYERVRKFCLLDFILLQKLSIPIMNWPFEQIFCLYKISALLSFVNILKNPLICPFVSMSYCCLSYERVREFSSLISPFVSMSLKLEATSVGYNVFYSYSAEKKMPFIVTYQKMPFSGTNAFTSRPNIISN